MAPVYSSPPARRSAISSVAIRKRRCAFRAAVAGKSSCGYEAFSSFVRVARRSFSRFFSGSTLKVLPMSIMLPYLSERNIPTICRPRSIRLRTRTVWSISLLDHCRRSWASEDAGVVQADTQRRPALVHAFRLQFRPMRKDMRNEQPQGRSTPARVPLQRSSHSRSLVPN